MEAENLGANWHNEDWVHEYSKRTPLHCRGRGSVGCIRDGAHVRLSGLRARQDLNGSAAVVEQYSHKRQRWAVRLSSGEAILVKPDNLSVDQVQPDGVPEAKAWLASNEPEGGFAQLPPVVFTKSKEEYERLMALQATKHPALDGVLRIVPPMPSESSQKEQGRQVGRESPASALPIRASSAAA
jgi:hypothetical protein